MQKRSHSLLANTLMKAHHGFSARRYEWAFVFGSIEPDCNPLSYLKGSLRARWLRGHNYGNSHVFLARRIARLQRCEHWGFWQYYTLGKLTHYMADAFIYPHNDHYPNSIWEHRRYENRFRLYLAAYLKTTTIAPGTTCANVAGAIEQLHRQYMSTVSGMRRDVRYIVEATQLLMTACLPQSQEPLAETA